MSGYDRTPGPTSPRPSSRRRESRRGYDSRASDVAPTPRRDNASVRSQRGSMRSQGRSEADRMPQTPTTVDRAYGRTDARSGRSGGSAKSGKSAAFRRDSSLAGFIKRLRDVEILSDVALGKIRASGHKMPGDLEAFQKRKDEVLRCVDEMKGQLRCYKCSRTRSCLTRVSPLSRDSQVCRERSRS